MLEEVLKQIAEELAKGNALLARSAEANEKMMAMYASRIGAKAECACAKTEVVCNPPTDAPVVELAKPATTEAAKPEYTDAERDAFKAELKAMGFLDLPRLKTVSLVKMIELAKKNIAEGKPANAGMPGNIPFAAMVFETGVCAPAEAAPVPTPAAPAAGEAPAAPVASSTPTPAPSAASVSPATSEQTPDDDFGTVEISDEDLRTALRGYAAKHSVEKAKAIMATFNGAQKASDVPQNMRAAFVQKLAV